MTTKPRQAASERDALRELVIIAKKIRAGYRFGDSFDAAIAKADAVLSTPVPKTEAQRACSLVLTLLGSQYPDHPPPDWVAEIERALRIGEKAAALARDSKQAMTPIEQAAHALRDTLLIAETLDKRPRPLCRDCADNDGTCQTTGMPCNTKGVLANARAALSSLEAAKQEPLTFDGVHFALYDALQTLAECAGEIVPDKNLSELNDHFDMACTRKRWQPFIDAWLSAENLLGGRHAVRCQCQWCSLAKARLAAAPSPGSGT